MLIIQQIALRFRTGEGFERERQQRSRAIWWLIPYFYAAGDFDPPWWRVYQLGLLIMGAGVLWYFVGPLFSQ